MDFMSAFPYWGILVLVLINAWLVSRRKIAVEEREGKELEH